MRKLAAKIKGSPAPTVDNIILEGLDHQLKGHYFEALRCFSDAIKRDPTTQKAYFQRSIIYLQKGYYERALTDLHTLFKLDPNNPAYLTQRGLIYGFLRSYSEALLDHNEALKIAVSNLIKSDILNNRGLAQLDPQKSLADFTEAIRLNPTHHAAYQNRGLLHVEFKRYPEALADFEYLVSVQFNTALMQVQCGAVLQRLNRHQEALVRFEQAIVLNPDCSEAYNNKGFSCHKLGDLDQAFALFTKAIEVDEKNSHAQYNIGFLLKSRGRYQDAMPYFAKAISLKYRDEFPDLPKTAKERALSNAGVFSTGAKQVLESWGGWALQIGLSTFQVAGSVAALAASIGANPAAGAAVSAAVELTGTVCQIGMMIYQQVQLVQANKQQCIRLSDRTLRVCDCIIGLDMSQSDSNYVLALQELESILKEGQLLVERFANKNWVKHVLFAGTYDQQFKEIYDRLKDSIQVLQLGLSAQQLLNEDDARQDAEADRAELKQNTKLIIHMNQEMKQQLYVMQLEQQDQAKILAQQFASMQQEFQYLLAGQALQPAVPSEFSGLTLIPFHILDIQKKIGQGKLGTIYKGIYNGEVVAIKEITGITGQEARLQFLREAKIMNHLRSRYFALFYGVCCEAGREYLVMEYLSNGPLDHYLKEKVSNLSERHQIIHHIVLGLKYLHHSDVYHRDLISANILIDEKGTAKIADFGMAKVSQAIVKYSVDKKVQLRASSPKCLAPESFNLNNVAQPEKRDIYSLGILIWEILTGKMAYEGLSESQIIAHVQMGGREVLPGFIPSFYRELIEMCWHSVPEKRPSIHEVVQKVENYTPPNIDALFEEGLAYENNEKYQQAVACYEVAAFYGSNYSSTRARTNLGGLYYDGFGVGKDEEKAHELFLQSANENHIRAMENVAKLYEKGCGKHKPDLRQAHLWLEKAAALGSKSASQKLSALPVPLPQIGQGGPLIPLVPRGRGSQPTLFNNNNNAPPKTRAAPQTPGCPPGP